MKKGGSKRALKLPGQTHLLIFQRVCRASLMLLFFSLPSFIYPPRRKERAGEDGHGGANIFPSPFCCLLTLSSLISLLISLTHPTKSPSSPPPTLDRSSPPKARPTKRGRYRRHCSYTHSAASICYRYAKTCIRTSVRGKINEREDKQIWNVCSFGAESVQQNLLHYAWLLLLLHLPTLE